MPDYDRRFTVKAAKRGSAYRKLPRSIDLNAILRIKKERTVQRDNAVCYNSRVFQIMPHNGRVSYKRAKATLQERTDNSIHVLYRGKELRLRNWLNNQKKLLENPGKFNLKDFLRQEIQSKDDLLHVT